MRWRGVVFAGLALVLASCSTAPAAVPTRSRPSVSTVTTIPSPVQAVRLCPPEADCRSRIGRFPGLCRGVPKPDAVVLTSSGRWAGSGLLGGPNLGHYRLPRSSRNPRTVETLFRLACESIPTVLRDEPFSCPTGGNVTYVLRFFAPDEDSVTARGSVVATFWWVWINCWWMALIINGHMARSPDPAAMTTGAPKLLLNLQDRMAALAQVPPENLFPTLYRPLPIG